VLDAAFDGIAAATGDADKPTIKIDGVDYDFADDFEEGAQTGEAVAQRAAEAEAQQAT